MIESKISHPPQDILSKEFKIDTRGYRLKEVDQYLDEVIEDMETLLDYIKKLEKENEELMTDIINLKHELRNVKTNIDVATSDVKEVTNMDILRRISNLEKIVYGKDE